MPALPFIRIPGRHLFAFNRIHSTKPLEALVARLPGRRCDLSLPGRLGLLFFNDGVDNIAADGNRESPEEKADAQGDAEESRWDLRVFSVVGGEQEGDGTDAGVGRKAEDAISFDALGGLETHLEEVAKHGVAETRVELDLRDVTNHLEERESESQFRED